MKNRICIDKKDVLSPARLRLIAHWFDIFRPGESDEVQVDLRKMADAIEDAISEGEFNK